MRTVMMVLPVPRVEHDKDVYDGYYVVQCRPELIYEWEDYPRVGFTSSLAGAIAIKMQCEMSVEFELSPYYGSSEINNSPFTIIKVEGGKSFNDEQSKVVG